MYILVNAKSTTFVPQFPEINYICHSFSLTDDYWDSEAPLAINQTGGRQKRIMERGRRKDMKRNVRPSDLKMIYFYI